METHESLREIENLRFRFQMNNRLRLESLAAVSKVFRECGEPITDELLAGIVFALPQELVSNNGHSYARVEQVAGSLPDSPQKPGNPPDSPQKPGVGNPPDNPPESPQRPGVGNPPDNPPESPQTPGNPPDSPQKPGNPPDSPQKPGNPPDSPQKPGNPPDSPHKAY
jgi:hypothetical protein